MVASCSLLVNNNVSEYSVCCSRGDGVSYPTKSRGQVELGVVGAAEGQSSHCEESDIEEFLNPETQLLNRTDQL